MHLSLSIIYGQLRFDPPQWLFDGIERIISCRMNVVADERHDKSMTLFEKPLECPPLSDDHGLIPADRVFIEHGYGSTFEILDYLKSLNVDRMLVCALKAEKCGLQPGLRCFMRNCSRH